MNLVFYSGGCEIENVDLDKYALKLAGTSSPTLTYIPSCSYESEVEFNDFIRHYRRFGIERFIHFAVDVPYDDIIYREAFKSDIIHLGGGNTYYFLKHLRKRKLLPELKEFVNRGGVLTGLSAGGIILTPNIDTAGFPEFDRDDNDEGVKNFKSLGLVDFEFFPHYKNSKRYDVELLAHSKRSKNKIYACPDGSGVIVDNGSTKFVGTCYCFFDGKKLKISGAKKTRR